MLISGTSPATTPTAKARSVSAIRPAPGSVLGGGELAAGTVDLLAPGVAHGDRDAVRLQAADELPLVLGPGGGPLRPGGGVERDQVDVHQVALEQAAEQVGAPGLVVDVADERVLDGDPAAGGAGVAPGRVEHLVDLPPVVDRDQLAAELVVGGVQRDGQPDLHPLGDQPV